MLTVSHYMNLTVTEPNLLLVCDCVGLTKGLTRHGFGNKFSSKLGIAGIPKRVESKPRRKRNAMICRKVLPVIYEVEMPILLKQFRGKSYALSVGKQKSSPREYRRPL